MKKLLQSLFILLFVAGSAMAQERTITGTVTDSGDGKPLPGVTIRPKGGKGGTQSASDGRYSIKVPSGITALEFTYLGYVTLSRPLGTSNVVNAGLQSDSQDLNELVVVGYGTQKRGEITGSTASVSGAAIAEKPVQSFESGLAGRASGVQITVPTGILNAPPVFRIRGTNSVSLSSQPLFVIDGIVATTGDQSLTATASNPLSSINPNDIESIDIAKDAASTAIYGSRAANGVVFVTTKKGKTGAPRVGYDAWVGWSSPYRLPKLLDAFQYTDYKNEAVANANSIRPGSVNFNLGTVSTLPKFALTNGPDGSPINTNWLDYAYRTGFSQSHNVNVSGGTEATKYYLGAGYTKQQGIYEKNDFKRMNALFNIDSKINDYLWIGGKLSYSNEQNLAAISSGSLSGEAYGTAGIARTAVVNAPNVSPYNNDGSYNLGGTFVGPMNNVVASNQVGFYNFVQILEKNRENNETDHMQSNAYIQVNPFKWLNLRSVYGIDYIGSDNDIFYNPIHGTGQGPGGEGIAGFRKRKNWTWTNTANAVYSVDKHNFNLLIGQEQQRNTVRGFGIDRQGLTDPLYDNVQAGFSLNNSTLMIREENYLLSYFGRLNYNYDGKYFLSGNLRQDEYSALGQKKGTFWGASAGWEITKENFWQNSDMSDIFSSFKLRGSYGKVGNVAGIPNYATFTTFAPGLYGGTPSSVYNAAGNKDLKWETSKKTDIGFNFGVLNDRLTVEAAYYKNNIDGLIINVPQAPSAGVPSSILMNAGSMYNKGFELAISGKPVMTNDFSWTSNFNISFNKNEVTALAPGLNEIIYATGSTATGENVNRTAPGYSLGYLYVVRTGGVDPATGRRIFIDAAGRKVTYQHINPLNQPNWRYLDDNSTAPAITQSADAVMYRNTAPKVYGGFDNTFRYKGFDLNVMFTYQLGFYVSYGTNAGLHDQRFWNNAVDVLGRWQQAGQETDFPRAVYGDNVSYGNTIPLDINVFKGDFVKLRNLSLGYTIPSALLSKYKLSNLRFYVSGQNLAIITKYPGPDPEVASNGVNAAGQGSDRNSGPNARTYTMGLSLGF
ncbi:SusC/RagA family TonB-linked outer membrane protein [Pedobacter sp. PACM 27299]|uniref:SusC/RagA family TonB-linked outer membrane protein n=1 Tax=Pedobacter sp. PACM 27299 TaxID=1727164 RepID=UPI0007067775|nr:TonB-dependent receptor [Pedobacter sp. PACM 27299]ALL08596.1 SusC/RagA family TonB-linked outer membrane protein [Pedobacter sp. PACM 27299]